MLDLTYRVDIFFTANIFQFTMQQQQQQQQIFFFLFVYFHSVFFLSFFFSLIISCAVRARSFLLLLIVSFTLLHPTDQIVEKTNTHTLKRYNTQITHTQHT